MPKNVFKKGAWLYTLVKELSEKEFIEKSGGMSRLNKYKQYKFVSLVLDNLGIKKPLLIGHDYGDTIGVVMSSRNHKNWQTMEWR